MSKNFAYTKTELFHLVPPVCKYASMILVMLLGLATCLFFAMYNPIFWQTIPCTISAVNTTTLTPAESGLSSNSYAVHVTFQFAHPLPASNKQEASMIMCRAKTMEQATNCYDYYTSMYNTSTVCTYFTLNEQQVQLYEQASTSANVMWLASSIIMTIYFIIVCCILLGVLVCVYKRVMPKKSWTSITKLMIFPRVLNKPRSYGFDEIPLRYGKYIEALEDEQVLWHEKPQAALLIVQYLKHPRAILFAISVIPTTLLLLAAVSFFPFIVGFVIAYVFLALAMWYYFLIGAFFTYYVMTNKRVIRVESDLLSTIVSSLEFEQIENVEIHESGDGKGGIFWGQGITQGFSRSFLSFYSVLGFESVNNFIEVSNLFKQQQETDEQQQDKGTADNVTLL